MIVSRQRRAIRYTTSLGEIPFDTWFAVLRDVMAKAKLAARIERAEKGNFGNYRELGESLYEIKDPSGPGYRVYFGLDGVDLIVLLAGGDKRSQSKDITKARAYWADYKERKKHE